MIAPRLIRRLVLVPLVIVMAASLAVLTPLVALLSAAFKVSAAFNLVRGQARPGRASRSRALRVACLALAWSVGETAALTVLLCLWIASGFGGRLGTESYQARHYMVMRSFLNLMYRVAQRACGLRVRVAGRPGCPGRAIARSSCCLAMPAPVTHCCSSTTCSAPAGDVRGSS